MSIRPFIAGKSFDPAALDMLEKAFADVCADLGVGDKTPHSRALVARKVIELADGRNDAAEIRAAVVALLKTPH
jgi:hypothetical protein